MCVYIWSLKWLSLTRIVQHEILMISYSFLIDYAKDKERSGEIRNAEKNASKIWVDTEGSWVIPNMPCVVSPFCSSGYSYREAQ